MELHPKVYEVARERFRTDYEKSYPKPVRSSVDKPTMQAFWSNPMVWVDLVIIFAATLMSALRTFHVLRTVGSSVEGGAGIIVIEGVTGFITFFLVLQAYRESGKVSNKIAGWMQALVLTSILLALLTNVYSIMIYQDATLSAVEWLLFILAGSIAVFAISILSHILGTLYVQNLSLFENAMDTYRDEMNALEELYKQDLQAWADEFERQWAKPTVNRRWLGMVNALYQQEQVSAVGVPVQNPVQFSPMPAVQNERSIVQTNVQNERPIGFAVQSPMGKASKPAQVADILRTDPALARKPYSEILQDERIASITRTKATISAAFNLNRERGE